MKRLECLNGLRGLAALSVLIDHCMLLTGLELPVVGQPRFGVASFIFLSGFLMVFQYQQRRDIEDWRRFGTWASFWARRFFRIAPLFYVMLAVALVLGPTIYDHRVAIDLFFDREIQRPERYLDASGTNIALHLSFLFGLFPEYAFRTPLPDWTLGLEMQFYAVFPLLVLLARKLGWPATAVLVALIGIAIAGMIGQAGIAFPMPAFLPLRMHLFLCGMLIAAAAGDATRLPLHFGLALALAAIPVGGDDDLVRIVMREAILTVFFALVHLRRITVINFLSGFLATKPFDWLGKLSYGVYLIHLLLMQPVAGWAIERWGLSLTSAERFLLVLGIVTPLTYALAYVTYMLIEMPCQRLGMAILRRFAAGAGRSGRTRAEEITAP